MINEPIHPVTIVVRHTNDCGCGADDCFAMAPRYKTLTPEEYRQLFGDGDSLH